MAVFSRDFNPFANIDLHVPKAYKDDVQRYSGRTDDDRGDLEAAPFTRMVDVWFLALCIGVSEGQPQGYLELPSSEQHRFHTGQVLQNDLPRIEFLLLNAISHTGDPYVVGDARRAIQIADAYAAGGMPYLMEMVTEGHSSPMTNVTMALLRELGAETEIGAL